MNQPEIQKECKGTERLVGTGLKWREGEGGDWTERQKDGDKGRGHETPSKRDRGRETDP